MADWNSVTKLILVILLLMDLALTVKSAGRRSRARRRTRKLKRQSPYAGSGNSFCYSIGGEGFHPHPEDCRKFIRCVEQGRRTNGDKLLTRFDFDCAPGTVYDPDLFICNFPGHGGTPLDCGGYAEEPFFVHTTRRPAYQRPAQQPPEPIMEVDIQPGGFKPETTTKKPCGCNLSGAKNNKDECNPVNGQCKCKNNVQGPKCDTCKPGYFNLDPNNRDGCSPCECNLSGTQDNKGECDPVSGQCKCKTNIQGLKCDSCKDGFPILEPDSPEGCLACDCNLSGTEGNKGECDPLTGDCICKENVEGPKCDSCKEGFPILEPDSPEGCLACDCNLSGTQDNKGECDPLTGDCICKANVQGPKCDTCKEGFPVLDPDNPDGCSACGCNLSGTQGNIDECDPISGECTCKANVQGPKCDTCKEGFSNLDPGNPEGCSGACDCNVGGTEDNKGVCEPTTGQCKCKANVQGPKCDACKDGYFKFDPANPEGCEACQCNLGGAQDNKDECDATSGECKCKANVQGPKCDSCKEGYFKMDPANPQGCEACQCNLGGAQDNKDECDATSGECKCKANVQGPKCDTCKEGFTNLDPANPEGCSACECNLGGSQDNKSDCDPSSGECKCKANVQGPKCDSCKEEHFKLDPDNPAGCSPCDCNLNGTMGNMNSCYPISGDCNCKANVQGPMCTECKEGSFNFDGENPDGCSPCLCFGHTSKCHSAEGYNFVPVRSVFAKKAGAWKAADHASGAEVMLDWSKPLQDVTVTAKTDDQFIYYVAPASYLGEQRRSYNKFLNFTLYLEDDKKEFISSKEGVEDIIIEGAGGQKLTLSVFKNGGIGGVPLPNATPRNYSFKIHPSEPWEPKLTEAQYLKLLSNLKSLKIRGTYTKQGKSYLDNVFLETLRKLPGGPPALSVEECECPTGYTGLSCESCADGFMRASCGEDPLSECIPCDCTTKCPGEDLTTCLMCGSASEQIPSTVIPDLLEAAPPNESPPTEPPPPMCDCNIAGSMNNVNECDPNTQECKCKANVQGPKCDSCKEGYSNLDPANPEGCSVACDCNLDGTEDNKGECDPNTGECKCKANVEGPKCDSCKEGFIKLDPMNPEGCEACECNLSGSQDNKDNCDPNTGECKCKANVQGPKCDSCKEEYGKIDPLNPDGCSPCDCFINGTINNTLKQCDMVTGNCACKSNVEGPTCNMCKDGYFNLDGENMDEGCSECFCFGHTTKCHSAEGFNFLPVKSVFTKRVGAWRAEILDTGVEAPIEWVKSSQDVKVTATKEDEIIYFLAPESYLGEQRRSFKRYLNFTFYIDNEKDFIEVGFEDLIIEGNGLRVGRMIFGDYGDDKMLLPTIAPQNYSFYLHPDAGWEPKLTEGEFLKMLSGLTALKIRGTYTATGSGFIDNVFMETARKIPGGPPVLAVEECDCPPEYAGLSCEHCANGFMRKTCDGDSFAECVPCDCNKVCLDLTMNTCNC